MRIVILGTAYPYRGGGIATFNERLATELQNEGHEVEIYTFTLQYPSFLFPGKTQYSAEPAPAHLKIKRKVNSCNPLNWISVGRELKRMKPDVMITRYWLPFMSPCLSSISRIVSTNGHTKILAIMDNVIPHEHRIGDKFFTKCFVNVTQGFVAMSKSVLADLSLFDEKKPRRFCPHPLYDHYGNLLDKQTARKNLQLPVEGNYVLFFGFIRDYKGLDILLQAMADQRVRDENITLIVAGEFYGNSEKYLSLIDSLGIANQVKLCTDFIPDSEVNQYFSACDIVAQPYKTATQSGVTQVAYHFEKPMLVTNVGGLPEIVPNGKIGYAVEPNAEQVADALVSFFQEKKEQEFIANLKIEKQKYAWSNMTKALYELAQEVN